jgi:hypothetical protein
MLFCQIGQAHSLREICGGLASCLGKLRHLGVSSAPRRSTLSYANEHRPWQIEVFFKVIKQNLRIKTFVGTSPNALMTQIWTALIAILILKYLQFCSKFGWSFSNLVAMLRYNLFTYRELWEWIDDPFETPAVAPDVDQLSIEWD